MYVFLTKINEVGKENYEYALDQIILSYYIINAKV